MIKMHRHVLSSCFVLLLCSTEAMAQYQVFLGERSSERDASTETQGTSAEKPKQELVKQEAKLDTYDPSSEFPEIKKTMVPGERLVGNVIERQLAIEWDSWHARFASEVRKRMFSNVFEASTVRPGAFTWCHCEVTPDKHLKSVRILKSSGDFWFDNAVNNAINKIDGMELLAFPKGSTRTIATTDICMQFGGRSAARKFGRFFTDDVEFRQLAPGENPDASKDSLKDSPRDETTDSSKRR